MTLAHFGEPTDGAAAGAADPLVTSSCKDIVDGVAGQEVLLDLRTVADPIAGVLMRQEALGGVREPFHQDGAALPTSPGRGVGMAMISGAQVVDAAIERLRGIPAVAPVLELLIPSAHTSLIAVRGFRARGDRLTPRHRRAALPLSPAGSGHREFSNCAQYPGAGTQGSSSGSAISGDVVRFGARSSGMWPWPAPGYRAVSVLGSDGLGSRDHAVNSGRTVGGKGGGAARRNGNAHPGGAHGRVGAHPAGRPIVRLWVVRSKRWPTNKGDVTDYREHPAQAW
jgi:hypothetical protein